MEKNVVMAKCVLMLNRQSEKSYGFFIPNFKEDGTISRGHGVYWFPKSLTILVDTGKLFFKEVVYEVIAPEWLFVKRRITDYEIVEMPIRGSK